MLLNLPLVDYIITFMHSTLDVSITLPHATSTIIIATTASATPKGLGSTIAFIITIPACVPSVVICRRQERYKN